MTDYSTTVDSTIRQRRTMVQRQIADRGIRSPAVLEAMAAVPREAFIPDRMREFAYEDSALPIDEGQTISQPYIVARMIDALRLEGGENVLEIGTGSGYAAAVLAQIAASVVTIERHAAQAEKADRLLRRQRYRNVEVIHGDGTLGWAQGAPYAAIVVTAGGPRIPTALTHQLAIGGRLVIPVGESLGRQYLVRVTRVGEDDFRQERLDDVRFVPLIGEYGWDDATPKASARTVDESRPSMPAHDTPTATETLIAAAAEPVSSVDHPDLEALLARIGEARVVLVGEASHGTSEFYRYRAAITRALIERKGFNIVAIEADWPDANRIDRHVRQLDAPAGEWKAFTRFPTWMWRNEEVEAFVDWLHHHNAGLPAQERVSFHGLDLYSLYTSIGEVLGYLDGVDPVAAAVARERYGCLTPWQSDPATYGRAATSGRYRQCQREVVDMLVDLMERRLDYITHDGESFRDAIQNARLIANAEAYYRSLYNGYSASWNLRDDHMFETLESLLDERGEEAKIVVWEHNSHIGDASATDMSARGQHNVGQLCRKAFGHGAYLIGFGTHGGTVAAADDWDAPMEIKRVNPSLEGSWERLCHDSGIQAFTLGLRKPRLKALASRLRDARLERAIGVIYRPQTEFASHYFKARLADQFDEYVWFDDTRAVTPLQAERQRGVPDTYPFGL